MSDASVAMPVEAVKEAIVYCQANPPEITDDFAREERIMAATGMITYARTTTRRAT